MADSGRPTAMKDLRRRRCVDDPRLRVAVAAVDVSSARSRLHNLRPPRHVDRQSTSLLLIYGFQFSSAFQQAYNRNSSTISNPKPNPTNPTLVILS